MVRCLAEISVPSYSGDRLSGLIAMKTERPCPACDSRYCLYVQDVIGQRSGKKIPQFICLDCHTLQNFSGYRETKQQQKDDFDYFVRHQDHTSALQNQLLLEIKARQPGIRTCCEIGYGTGLFLKACQYLGVEEYGFEVNRFAAEYAKKVVGVKCEIGLFTPKHDRFYDLIVAIGVFEHIEGPRDLFKLMVSKLNPDGAIYLNVPFVNRDDWKFLWDADKNGNVQPPNPFYDNDVHIIHYSIEGLRRLGLSFGARSAEYFVSKDVSTRSPGAYPGILFKF